MESSLGEGKLSRKIGLLGALSIGAGAVLGPGEYIVSGEIAAKIGPSAVIAFLGAGGLMCLTALSYAELGPMLPFAGGSFHFVKEGGGPLGGFLGGWACWLGLITATAFYTIGAAHFISNLLFPGLPVRGLVLLIIGIFTAVNVAGVRTTTLVEIILFVSSLGIILAFVVFGLPHMQASNHSPFFAVDKGWTDVLPMAAVITVNFVGFDLVAATAGEIKNPGRNVPAATLLSLVMMVLLVGGVVWVATGVVNYPQMRGSSVPIALAARSFAGKIGFTAVSIGGILACLTGINASLLAASRYLFTLSNEGALPEKFAKIHSKLNTPFIAVLLTGGLTAVIGFFANLQIAMGLTAAEYLFVFVLVNISLISLRRNRPEEERPFKVPLFPIPPIAGAVACTLLYFQLRMITILYGFGIIAVGALVFFWSTRINGNGKKNKSSRT